MKNPSKAGRPFLENELDRKEIINRISQNQYEALKAIFKPENDSQARPGRLVNKAVDLFIAHHAELLNEGGEHDHE